MLFMKQCRLGDVSIALPVQRMLMEVAGMTASTYEKESRVGGSPPQTRGKATIPVKLGYAEDRIVELELGSHVAAVLEVVAAERGCLVDELVLIREQDNDPLDPTTVVDVNYPSGCRHHVHGIGEVTVTVNYQESQFKRSFKRFEAVKDVLAWALEVFPIDEAVATEFELARHGQKEELFGAEHIGHLAGKNCELELDLVRGDIANGSSS